MYHRNVPCEDSAGDLRQRLCRKLKCVSMARLAMIACVAAMLAMCATHVAAGNPNFYIPPVTGLNNTVVRDYRGQASCCRCTTFTAAHARVAAPFAACTTQAMVYVEKYHAIMQNIMSVAKGDVTKCPQAEKLLYETAQMLQVRPPCDSGTWWHTRRHASSPQDSPVATVVATCRRSPRRTGRADARLRTRCTRSKTTRSTP